MQKVFHAADSRGHANHGWLNAKHSFSFANYFDPNRIQFGALRILNDDTIAGGMGFGTHPHDNMEIITIPLDGALEHKDSMGNAGVIRHGEIQVMSAGTGIYHSEFNHLKEAATSLLQIWVFPNKKNVSPRYDQKSIEGLKKTNQFYPIVTPNTSDSGMWIHQDAWFHLGDFDTHTTTSYRIHKKGNGVYVFTIEGDARVADETLSRRDALGIWDTEVFEISAKPGTRLLLMEVPMN